MSWENPPLYCTLALIARQGHQQSTDKRPDELGLQLIFFKKNLNIPQSGEKMSKRLGGIIGCKDKPLHDIQSVSPMVLLVVTLGQQYNIG